MMNDTTFDPAVNPIFISNDNYILDGHHRWAAVVGRDAADGKLGDSMMHVTKVDSPISELLHVANTWANAFGIKQTAGVQKQGAATGLTKPKPQSPPVTLTSRVTAKYKQLRYKK